MNQFDPAVQKQKAVVATMATAGGCLLILTALLYITLGAKPALSILGLGAVTLVAWYFVRFYDPREEMH